MIDAVIYGYDGRGRLILEERAFAELLDLAWYMCTPEAARWQWAEVVDLTVVGTPQLLSYPAGTLRAMAMMASSQPICQS